jgi:hypothetical protein
VTALSGVAEDVKMRFTAKVTGGGLRGRSRRRSELDVDHASPVRRGAGGTIEYADIRVDYTRRCDPPELISVLAHPPRTRALSA